MSYFQNWVTSIPHNNKYSQQQQAIRFIFGVWLSLPWNMKSELIPPCLSLSCQLYLYQYNKPSEVQVIFSYTRNNYSILKRTKYVMNIITDRESNSDNATYTCDGFTDFTSIRGWINIVKNKLIYLFVAIYALIHLFSRNCNN